MIGADWSEADWQELFDGVDAYLEEVDAEGDFAAMTFKNTFIEKMLYPLEDAVQAAANQSGPIQAEYIARVELLRDRSIALGRANILKENDSFKTIGRFFPTFMVPGKDIPNLPEREI